MYQNGIIYIVTRKNPELCLDPNKSFYEYSNEVINDPEYKKTNPTANQDVRIRKYTHRPFIKLPIAQ